MQNSGFVNSLKYILTTLAVINLILLFGFHYEIPSVIKDRFLKEETTNTPTDTKEAEKQEPLNLIFETDLLSYDGSSSLDLLEGVSVTDEEGNPLDLDIYATVKSTDNDTKKTITYSVKDEEGNSCTAERTLLLKNYYGPALTIGQPYPDIYDIELKYIPTTFADSGLLSANDGYGKNITDAIQCTYTVTNDVATEVEIKFTVTNHFDDTISETITVPIIRTKPLILLTEESITIEKDASFNPLDYVESATNEEGENLTGLIKTTGEVNTSTAGTYEVSYTLTDRDMEKADTVTLRVTVKE